MARRQIFDLLPVDQLALDPENPRLPESLVHAPATDILKWLENNLVLEELAQSMVENGFFQNEPLVVLPMDRNSNYIVVEGNRRFATLAILLQLPVAQNAELAFDLRTEPTAEQLDALRQVPCLVVQDRDEVRQFLGFRHIGGLKTWSPEAKARYLAREIEIEMKKGTLDPFREVARRVGSTRPSVRDQYIALKVLQSARDDYRIDSSYVIDERFGVWNRLLNSPGVRKHIGLVSREEAEDVDRTVNELKPAGLGEVIGDLTPAGQSASSAVLTDSRNATIYGEVLQNERAHATLRRSGDLQIAAQVIHRGSITDRLRNIQQTLGVLADGIDGYDYSTETLVAAQAVFGEARSLRDIIQGRLNNDD